MTALYSCDDCGAIWGAGPGRMLWCPRCYSKNREPLGTINDEAVGLARCITTIRRLRKQLADERK